MKRKLLFTIVTAAVLSVGPAANAVLVLDLTQSGTGVTATLSGSGTIDTTADGTNPGAVLNFNNFSGSPFNAGISGTGSGSEFILPAGLMLSGSAIGTLRLDNDSGGADVDLLASASFVHGDAYAGSGTVTIPGLLFSELNPGTYTATGGDTSDFGGFTLNVIAESSSSSVPDEASSLLLLVIALFGGSVFLRKSG